MKILIDMNLSPRWVGLLTESGFEAVHWSKLGKANATDSEIMEYAVFHDCVVLTLDLDFGAILAVTHGNKPSVAQIRANDVNLSKIGKTVASALQQMQSELEKGALVTIDANRTRIRVLPLHP